MSSRKRNCIGVAAAKSLVFIGLSVVLVGTGNAQFSNSLQSLKDALSKAAAQKPATPAPGSGAQSPGGTAPGAPQGATRAADDGRIAPPPGTKIESTLLSPLLPGSEFIVSPLGIHMATLTHSGSRLAMLYDNVEGPKFDEIYRLDTSRVVFSPDGTRFAYCGLQGSAFVVMVDGKEAVRGGPEQTGEPVSGMSCFQIAFTSNNKHVYFYSEVRTDASHQAYRFVFDGQPGILGVSTNLNDLHISPDGDHFANFWNDPNLRGRPRPDSTAIIVDGKKAPLYSLPLWTPDSKHIYSMAEQSGLHGGITTLFFDGKPIAHGEQLRFFQPPVGDMAAIFVGNFTGNNFATKLIVGGKTVPGSENLKINGNVEFSADGKHYAVRCETPTHREFVFWDGKKGQEYERLTTFPLPTEKSPKLLRFTSEGKVVYQAYQGGAGDFLVIGDQESGPIKNVTWGAVAPGGGHAMLTGAGQVDFDGKLLALPPTPQNVSWPGFSPDGAHYAFVLDRQGAKWLFRDGVQQDNAMVTPNGPEYPFVFSPDGQHLAYACISADGKNETGMCLDGKFHSIAGGAPGGNAPYNLTFSADGNHLYWNTRPNVQIFHLYVDGAPVLESGPASNLAFPKETWQLDGPSGLILLAHDNEGYKRIRITPSPQSSIANMR